MRREVEVKRKGVQAERQMEEAAQQKQLLVSQGSLYENRSTDCKTLHLMLQ